MACSNPCTPCSTSCCKTPVQKYLTADAYDPCLMYSSSDDCVVYENKLARSLTAAENSDDPLTGSLKDPATWELKSLCNLMSGGTSASTDICTTLTDNGTVLGG